MSTALSPAHATAPAVKAVAFVAAQRAELIDWCDELSPLGATEISGCTLVSLVSPGTELNGYLAAREKPERSGYAVVFTVDAVGAAVRDVRVGDRMFCQGPHASRQRVERQWAVPVPADLDPAIAVFCRLMGVGWATLVTTTARPPDRVLVTGLGPVGNLAAQVFAAAGYRVTGVDPSAPRRELARRLGITEVGEAAAEDGGFQLALECSGHEQAVLACCRAVRKRGEVALVGVPWKQRSDLSAHALLHAVFHRYVVLRSGWEWEVPSHARDFAVGSILGNFAGALDWLKSGRVRVEGLAERAHPAEAQRVWQDLLHQRGPCPTAIFDWSLLERGG